MEQIKGTDEAWDSRALGQDERFASVSGLKIGDLDEALDLQMISIRLPRELIEDMKLIAGYHRLGYQPLIRQVLTRFIEAEAKNLFREYAGKLSEPNNNDEEHDGGRQQGPRHRKRA